MDRARALAGQIWAEMLRSDGDFAALELDADGIRNFKWTAWRAIEGLWDLEDPTTVEVVARSRRRCPSRSAACRSWATSTAWRTGSDGLVISDYKSGRAPGRKFSERPPRAGAPVCRRPRRDARHPPGAGTAHVPRPADRRGRPSPPRTIAEVTQRLADTWEELLRTLGDTGEFPPQPGPLCGWCAFVRHCPEGLAEVERRHLAGSLRPDAPALAEAV